MLHVSAIMNNMVQLKEAHARSLLLLLFFLLDTAFKFGKVQAEGLHGLPVTILLLLLNIALSFVNLARLD